MSNMKLSEKKKEVYSSVRKITAFCGKVSCELKDSIPHATADILKELLLLQDYIQGGSSDINLISELDTIGDLIDLLKSSGFDDEVSSLEYHCETKLNNVHYVFIYKDNICKLNSRVDSFIINIAEEKRQARIV